MYNGVLIGHPLMNRCQKFLSRHKPLTHQQWLERIAQVTEVDLDIDLYNSGPAIDLLEQKMAALLGKEKALFVHKGMVGQNSALMAYACQSNNNTIAIHPQSHIHVDEALAYKKLMGLEAVFFGKEFCAIDLDDVKNLPDSLAAICVELPTRRAGFKLPQWQTLVELKVHASERGIPIHFDGARMLECADYWQKSYAEVAAISDSCYVSLYKMLGAPAGGIIAGNNDFIENLKPWRTRFGGDMFTAFPYVLPALWGLEHYLPRVSEFNQRAVSLSQKIAEVFGEKAIVNPVQCNGFVVELPVGNQKLEHNALKVAEQDKIWLFDRIYDVEDNISRFELQVGDALDDWSDDEVISTLKNVVTSS